MRITVNIYKPFTLIFLTLAFLNCNNQSNKPQEKPAIDTALSVKDLSIPGNFSSQTKLKFDSSVLKIFLDSFPLYKIFKNDFDSFYINRNFSYAWYDGNGMIEPANNLFNRIENINEEGLTYSMPYLNNFKEMMEAAFA